MKQKIAIWLRELLGIDKIDLRIQMLRADIGVINAKITNSDGSSKVNLDK